jgi:hypothetical protein
MRTSLLFLMAFLCLHTLLAQRRNSTIVDDSTQQLYNFNTARYLLEPDLLQSKQQSYPVDSLIHNLHQFTFPNRYDNKYVDLGNLGTAIRPVFYQAPKQIGTRLGLETFDLYAFQPESVRYYDTRSPYSHLYYIQGGRGQQILEAQISRNVNKQWNLGVHWRNISTQYQYGLGALQRQGSFASRQTIHNSIIAKTRYFTKDSLYQVLAYYAHMNHFIGEQGGVNPSSINFTQDDLLQYREELAKLNYADGRDFRNGWHIYQEFTPFKGLQVFHIFDRERQDNQFNANSILTSTSALFPPDSAFYRSASAALSFRPQFQDTLLHQSRYRYIENKIGLKGRFGGFDYRAYFRHRYYTFFLKNRINGLVRSTQSFVGLVLDYQFNNRSYLHTEAEYQLFGDYRLDGIYSNRFWKMEVHQMLYSPTIVDRFYVNDFFRWANPGFKRTFYTQLKGQLQLKLGSVEFSPMASVTNLSDLIYYDTLAVPKQSGEPVQILSIGSGIKSQFGSFHADAEAIVTQVTGATELIRIPQLFANFQFYYANQLFKKALRMEAGIQVHYKSDYYAYAYMPITTKFYLQNDFLVKAYPLVDLFVNIRIKTARAFFRVSHVNQGLPAKGYFTTPYYFGLPRSLGFGISWQFFD